MLCLNTAYVASTVRYRFQSVGTLLRALHASPNPPTLKKLWVVLFDSWTSRPCSYHCRCQTILLCCMGALAVLRQSGGSRISLHSLISDSAHPSADSSPVTTKQVPPADLYSRPYTAPAANDGELSSGLYRGRSLGYGPVVQPGSEAASPQPAARPGSGFLRGLKQSPAGCLTGIIGHRPGSGR